MKAFRIRHEAVAASVFYVSAETAEQALAKMREHFDADDEVARGIYLEPDNVEDSLEIESNDEFDVPEEHCVA